MNKKEQLINKLVDDYFNHHHIHLYKEEEIKISSISEDEYKNHISNRELTLEIVKEWVEGGGDVDIQNKYGWTALIWASCYDYLEIVQYLIKNDVKLDIQNNIGYTALIWASSNGHLEIVEVLVENGAKIDIQNNNGYTALSLAKNKIIKDYLISKGAK